MRHRVEIQVPLGGVVGRYEVVPVRRVASVGRRSGFLVVNLLKLGCSCRRLSADVWLDPWGGGGGGLCNKGDSPGCHFGGSRVPLWEALALSTIVNGAPPGGSSAVSW